MKRISTAFYVFILFFVCHCFAQAPVKSYDVPVKPGVPGSAPFWNIYAKKFIYAPAFNAPAIPGAVSYQFAITDVNGKTAQFSAKTPWSALSTVWANIPQGATTLTINAIDKNGKLTGQSYQRSFYRDAPFPGVINNRPAADYHDAARRGIKALFLNPSVQYWLTHATPDPGYRLYAFPNKVIGALIRAMVTYSKIAETSQERSDALKIAKAEADYLLSIRFDKNAGYPDMPPTYKANTSPVIAVVTAKLKQHLFMVTSAMDAAFGFLDIYDATHDEKYLDACKKIANTLTAKQNAAGTWPHLVNTETGEPAHSQLLVPTWVIFFLDRLNNQYHINTYQKTRERAWNWIVNNPLKTYQWDGQFEDVRLSGPYEDLAREQACDVAEMLLSDPAKSPAKIAQAEDLLRFAEDQFVVWAPIKDPEGWKRVMADKVKRSPETWITPSVLEQYVCYEPVARSSAVLINVYLKAYQATKKKIYFEKAQALSNGLLEGQDWVAGVHKNKDVEIPTWVKRQRTSNWLNNSFYAAEAVLNMANSMKK